MAAGADLSKLGAFLMVFPPNQIDLILKLTNHNLSESSKKLLIKIMLLCYSLVGMYAIGDGFGDKTGKLTYLPSTKFNRTGIKY